MAQITVAPCREVPFDILGTASQYSTLTGVLAGFAFTGLITLLTARLRGDADQSAFEDAAQALTVAFVGLIFTSVSYAVLRGARWSAARAAGEEVICGLGFAVSAILLFYALALVFDAAEQARSPVASYVRSLFGFVFAPLGVVYLAIGSLDFTHAHHDHPKHLPLIAGAFAVVPLGAAALGRWKPRGRPAGPLKIAGFLKAMIGGFLVSAVLFAYSEYEYGACHGVSLGVIVAVLAVNVVLMTFTAWRFSRDAVAGG